jgi:hypothetical protein
MEHETVREQDRDHEVAQAGGGWKLEAGPRSPSPTQSLCSEGGNGEQRASGVSPRTSLFIVVVISAALALTLAALPPLSTPGAAPLLPRQFGPV